MRVSLVSDEVGVGTLVGRGLRGLAKMAETMDLSTKKPAKITESDHVEILETQRAMSMAIEQLQQHVVTLQQKIAILEASASTIKKSPLG